MILTSSTAFHPRSSRHQLSWSVNYREGSWYMIKIPVFSRNLFFWTVSFPVATTVSCLSRRANNQQLNFQPVKEAGSRGYHGNAKPDINAATLGYVCQNFCLDWSLVVEARWLDLEARLVSPRSWNPLYRSSQLLIGSKKQCIGLEPASSPSSNRVEIHSTTRGVSVTLAVFNFDVRIATVV